MPEELPIDNHVCICTENTIYFYIQSQESPIRVYVADCEFWQDAVGLL